jgi:hypothetical protein
VSLLRMAAFRSSSSRVRSAELVRFTPGLTLAPLCFLALAAGGGALVELAAAGLREDPCLLDLLVEAAKRSLERLAIANDHLRQLPGSPALSGHRRQRRRPSGVRQTRMIAAGLSPKNDTDARIFIVQPGGQPNARPASTCKCRCQISWPALSPLFTTTRNCSAYPASAATFRTT